MINTGALVFKPLEKRCRDAKHPAMLRD